MNWYRHSNFLIEQGASIMYHTKKIGIFISHIFGDFQHKLCQGIIDKASEFGYTSEIFSSSDGEDVGDYGIGEISILRIPNFNEFSGICFASGTYLLPALRDTIAKKLRETCACPILEITQSDAVFPHIELDNDTAAGQLTEHMIMTHHHKRICYLGCSTEPFFSEKRLFHYRNTLKKFNLPLAESDYFSCDYEYSSIETALQHFLQSGKPDSIICYNDRMAISLMDILYRHGYRIPEDIAVAGFDYSDIGQNILPALSTVTFPVYEMGQKAMELLLDAMNGAPLPNTTVLVAEPLYHNSCGCSKKKNKPLCLYEQHLMEHINILENSMLNDIKMSSALCSVRDLDEGMELLERFLPRIRCCYELYICLYQNWDAVSAHIQEITAAQEEETDEDILIMPFAYRNGKRLHECSFTKKSILPNYIYDGSRSSYVFSPLFFKDRKFGYLALSYQDNRLACQFDLLTWIFNVNRMLNALCESKQTNLLVNHLEEVYLKDDLTGLYNHRGFWKLANPLLEQAAETNASLLTMVFDIDDLKTINNTFGHLEGDFAIQVLGHALEHASQKELITARLSGDAFYILAMGLTEADAKDITLNVNQYLEHYNRIHTKKYVIHVNIGYALINSRQVFDIQKIFDSAEKQLSAKKNKRNTTC